MFTEYSVAYGLCLSNSLEDFDVRCPLGGQGISTQEMCEIERSSQQRLNIAYRPSFSNLIFPMNSIQPIGQIALIEIIDPTGQN